MHDTAAHRVTRWDLRLTVIGYLLFLVIWPVALVAAKTFANGLAPVINVLRQPDVIFAFQLTLSAAFWAVMINTIFGYLVALGALHVSGAPRAERNGRSAAVCLTGCRRIGHGAGLQRPYRLAGQDLEQTGLQVIYAPPGIIMATAFCQPAARHP
jgi:sulfate/thiosulfate transport system permease protein